MQKGIIPAFATMLLLPGSSLADDARPNPRLFMKPPAMEAAPAEDSHCKESDFKATWTLAIQYEDTAIRCAISIGKGGKTKGFCGDASVSGTLKLDLDFCSFSGPLEIVDDGSKIRMEGELSLDKSVLLGTADFPDIPPAVMNGLKARYKLLF